MAKELGLSGPFQASDQTPPEPAKQLRQAFEELGPTFIKLGQILSTRPDLFPPTYIKEFSKLTDQISPIPYSQIQERLEKEFLKPLNELYESFDQQPIAAASIAQVHRAVLKSAESGDLQEVVVKVQRPGITELIESDIQILYFLAQSLEKLSKDLQLFNLIALVEEFQRSIHEELDFTLEARNIDSFNQMIESESSVLRVPRVIWPMTSSKVLTMSRVKGVTLSQLHEFPAHLNRKKLAESTVQFFLEGIFFHGLFHCDAHAGNLLIDTEGEGGVGLVDFGMVGRLNGDLQEKLSRLFLALVTQDFESLAFTYTELAEFGRGFSVREFQSDLQHLLGPNINRPLAEVDVGSMMQESLVIAQKHRIRLPRDLISFFRAVVTLEHIGRTIDPEFNFLEFGSNFSKEIFKRQFSRKKITRELFRTFDSLRSLPSALRSLAMRLEHNDLFPQFQGLENGLRVLKRSNQLLSLAIVFFGLSLSATMLTIFLPDHFLSLVLWILAGLCLIGGSILSLRS